MAASRSVSRKAAKKASKARKSGAKAKKAAKTRKQRPVEKKAAATRKGRAAAKGASARRTVPPAAPAAMPMPMISAALAEIDARIAIVRNNLRMLVEQAASYASASNEKLIFQRIADQEEKLERLRKQRDELARQGG